ncbi:Dynein assembly factor with WDR repeat domains 1 [Portunus trituberculatus]|uniref:Dynein assembly factor with WDR repeat domains 1 n=1 Tax=Portunus trituberculatus TaxID=210409 RepID=A0A5B7DUV7_PORTR|nr:Dynein assembly factor with WDR repeat domains 1 [Portunus trituberculatus]
MIDGQVSSWREIQLLDLKHESVSAVVEEVVQQERAAAGQRARLHRLVSRLLLALRTDATRTLTRHRTLRAHILPLTNVTLNKTATFELVATCSFDGTVRVWESVSGACELVMAGHEGPVAVVTPLPASKQPHNIKATHPAGECAAVLEGHSGAVVGVGGDRSGNLLYSASFDGTVRLWDGRSHECSGTLMDHEGEVNGAGLSWCGHFLASWATDASARVWDLRHTSKPIHVMLHDAERSMLYQNTLHEHFYKCICLTPHGLVQVVSGAWDNCGRQLVTGGVDRTARVLHVPSLTETVELEGHGGEVSKVSFSPSGSRVFTAGEDGHLRIWDATTGHCLQEERGHTSEIFSMAVSYEGDVLVTGSRDSTCVVWKHRAAEGT